MSTISKAVVKEKHFGYVKWYRTDKGYGFILPDTGGDDVFVHAKGVNVKGKNLREGARVSYTLVAGNNDKKLQAVNVVYSEQVSASRVGTV